MGDIVSNQVWANSTTSAIPGILTGANLTLNNLVANTISGATGAFGAIGCTGPIATTGDVSGATGSFTNVVATATVKGATGSFTNTVTGPTGTFTNLTASTSLTGATGAIANLSLTGSPDSGYTPTVSNFYESLDVSAITLTPDAGTGNLSMNIRLTRFGRLVVMQILNQAAVTFGGGPPGSYIAPVGTIPARFVHSAVGVNLTYLQQGTNSAGPTKPTLIEYQFGVDGSFFFRALSITAATGILAPTTFTSNAGFSSASFCWTH